jgi:hypothetical protein
MLQAGVSLYNNIDDLEKLSSNRIINLLEGETKIVFVALDTQPTHVVEVTFRTNDPDFFSVSNTDFGSTPNTDFGSTLLFNTSTYSTRQPIILYRSQPPLNNSIASFTVTSKSTDRNYDNLRVVLYYVGVGPIPCFGGSSLIHMALTDSWRPIRNVQPGHVILDAKGHQHVVRGVTRTLADTCVIVDCNVLAVNYPHTSVILTPNHLVQLHNGKLLRAASIGRALPRQRPRWVYHLLLDDWTFLDVGGLLCETCAWLPKHHAQRPYLKQ